jgi:RNA recognition motif-containing protein
MSYAAYYRRSISPRSIPREAAYPPPRRPPTAPARVEPNSVLGVFGLSIRTREADLEDEFTRYGDVVKVVIVYDQRASAEIEIARQS